jgi:hypothetical protein
MVLVAPAAPHSTGADADAGAGALAGERGSGREVLAQLRGDTDARPRFDPGLAGGLRAWLEDAAFEASAGLLDGAPLQLGPGRLLGSDVERGAENGRPTTELLLARLVHALFRQIVHTGSVGDPLPDALDSLDALGDRRAVDGVAALDGAERRALADALGRHTGHLSALVPRFAPAWLPRTDDYVAIPLAGGRVVLHGVFDLLVGLPRPGTASLCALGLTTGDWARQRRTLHLMALLETLRSGTPPFRLALLESATGRYGVEDVREEHLQAMAAHVAAWLARGGVSVDA